MVQALERTVLESAARRVRRYSDRDVATIGVLSFALTAAASRSAPPTVADRGFAVDAPIVRDDDAMPGRRRTSALDVDREAALATLTIDRTSLHASVIPMAGR